MFRLITLREMHGHNWCFLDRSIHEASFLSSFEWIVLKMITSIGRTIKLKYIDWQKAVYGWTKFLLFFDQNTEERIQYEVHVTVYIKTRLFLTVLYTRESLTKFLKAKQVLIVIRSLDCLTKQMLLSSQFSQIVRVKPMN